MSTYEDFPWNMGKPGNTVGKGYGKYGEQQKHGSTWGTWRVAVWLELPGRWGWLVWLVGGEQGFGVMVRLVNLILSMGKHAGFNASQSHKPGTWEVEGEKRWERERELKQLLKARVRSDMGIKAVPAEFKTLILPSVCTNCHPRTHGWLCLSHDLNTPWSVATDWMTNLYLFLSDFTKYSHLPPEIVSQPAL